MGETDWLGNITIQRGLKGPEFERALLHEAGHRTLSPTSGPMWLRKFRGEVVGATANQKSQLVRYLDEVYAERRAGASLGEALRYPFQHPEVYRVQKSRVIAEAVAYGTVVGGAAYVGWKIGE